MSVLLFFCVYIVAQLWAITTEKEKEKKYNNKATDWAVKKMNVVFLCFINCTILYIY